MIEPLLSYDLPVAAEGSLFPSQSSGPHTLVEAVIQAFEPPASRLPERVCPYPVVAEAERVTARAPVSYDPWREIPELAALFRSR